jgi:hypothetical protein
MSAVFHGIELDGNGKVYGLRLGILRLLYRLWSSSQASPTSDKQLQAWRDKFQSTSYKHQLNHFRQCILKFDQAAGHVARCINAADRAMGNFQEDLFRHTRSEIELPKSPLHDNDYVQANADLPLFLDSMLHYLRIQADSFADLVQYFYRPELSSFPSGNFGELAKSVATIDSAYRAIILANRKWFDVLAGDDGLRDVITHQGGMIGVSWEKQVDQPAKPHLSLYRKSGVVEENVFDAIKGITSGWFSFLDEAYRHFIPQLTHVEVLQGMSLSEPGKNHFFDGDEIRGSWVYPVVGSGK